VIRIEPGQRDPMITRSIEALGADPTLYQRAASLVFVTTTTDGAPAVNLMSAPTMGQHLSRFVTWERRTQGDDPQWVPADPPDPVVQAVLAAREWSGVRPLRGIIEAPTLRPDGSVLDRPGYDHETGYLYRPAIDFPRLDPAPTQEDARAAYAALEDVFADFPFTSAEDRAVAVSLALTLIARPALGCVPIFTFDAASVGTGKTLAAQASFALASGREADTSVYPTERGATNEEEVRKTLDAAARTGDIALFFDNVKAGIPFGTSAIEKAATAGSHKGRILGGTELFTTQWRTVIIATGNNLSVSPEMPRRTLRARMVSKFEKPSDRPLSDYQHPDRVGRLIEWIASNRPRLVMAALTLLRAFVLAGRPRIAARLPSFDGWSDLIASAIVWAGGPDPTACLVMESEIEQPEDNALRVILRDLPRLDEQARGITTRSILDRLYPEERMRGPVPPDGFEPLREAIEALAPPPRTGGRPDSNALGKAFAAVLEKNAGGRRLVHPRRADGEDKGARGSAALWVVEVVQKAAPPPVPSPASLPEGSEGSEG
jgi:putative DNA primase/helicase